VAHLETSRIADQIDRAVRGPAWHGPSFLEAIAGLSADAAWARPVPGAHTIAELVAHTASWLEITSLRLDGRDPGRVRDAVDWPPVGDPGEPAWRALVRRLNDAATAVERVVSRLDDGRLADDLPGVDDTWTVYVSLHGVVQHVLYHAGQAVLLRKAVGT